MQRRIIQQRLVSGLQAPAQRDEQLPEPVEHPIESATTPLARRLRQSHQPVVFEFPHEVPVPVPVATRSNHLNHAPPLALNPCEHLLYLTPME
jgi:hypothetical protein